MTIWLSFVTTSDRCGVLDLCVKNYGYELLLKGCPSLASLAETAYRGPPELLSRSAEPVMAVNGPEHGFGSPRSNGPGRREMCDKEVCHPSPLRKWHHMTSLKFQVSSRHSVYRSAFCSGAGDENRTRMASLEDETREPPARRFLHMERKRADPE